MERRRIPFVLAIVVALVVTGGPSLAGPRPAPAASHLPAADPALAGLLASGTVVTAVATGADHSCALTAAGGAKCWGNNEDGQLGDGTTTDRAVPVDVQGLSSGVRAIGAGGGHSCAVLTNGRVRCWGANSSGQLGDGTTTASLTPVEVMDVSDAAYIAVGSSHTCALTTSGSVRCWGANTSGQLGDGTTTSRGTPGGVTGLDSGVTKIVAGSMHTCALLEGGSVKCWGMNGAGQLGDGTTTSRTTPVSVSTLSGVTSLSAGYMTTCAATADGAFCWGHNGNGQLGDGTTVSSSVPVPVDGLGGQITEVSVGAMHACAVDSDGAVRCWGSNSFGQLGDGTTTDSLLPVSASGLTLPVSGLASGISHSCAITSIGGAACWGLNGSGQVGDGTSGGSRATPVTVVGLEGDDGTRYVMLPLLLSGYVPPAPVEAVVTPADGGTLTYTSQDGASVTVLVPQGAVTESITLRYSPRSDADQAPYGTAYAGQTFALQALRDDMTLDGFTFVQPVTVIVAYTDTQVKDVEEDTLALYTWDGSAWVDAAESCASPFIEREPEMNTIEVTICHLSDFALFGRAIVRWTTQVADAGEVPGAEYCFFLRTSLQIGSAGQPHIAYYNVCYPEESSYRARPRYVRLTPSGWVAQSLYHDRQNVGGFPSLALAADDTPHISYYVFDDGSLEYYTPQQGSSLVEGSSGVGRNTSIALTGQGTPCISYYDGRFITDQNKNEAVRLACKDGNDWALETVDAATGDWGWYGHTSLEFDGAGRPHVSYYDARNGDLRYAYRDGSTWYLATVDSAADVGSAGSMALDGGGRPHIAYYDATNADLKYARWTGSAWSIEVVDSAGDVGQYLSLGLDSADNPHIAYYDASNADLKYARGIGDTWEISTVDSEGNVGAHAALALDDRDDAHIAYADGTNKVLRYARTGQ